MFQPYSAEHRNIIETMFARGERPKAIAAALMKAGKKNATEGQVYNQIAKWGLRKRATAKPAVMSAAPEKKADGDWTIKATWRHEDGSTIVEKTRNLTELTLRRPGKEARTLWVTPQETQAIVGLLFD